MSLASVDISPKIFRLDETVPERSFAAATRFTRGMNAIGLPAISIPCGLGEGDRPIGLMLVAKHWQESTLYRAAHAFERAGNWQSMGSSGKR